MGLLNSVSPELYQTWARGLSDISESEIRRGMVSVRDFKGFFSLPAFRGMCQNLDIGAHGLPDAHRAYQEACLAPSPKSSYSWTHAAVYKAGILTGWSELHSMPKDKIFPVYARNYEILCRRVCEGEDLSVDVPKAIPSHIPNILTPEENHARMLKMRKELGL